MLKTIGAATLDQLIDETIPSDIRLKSDLDLEPAMTEFANHIQNWEIKIKFSILHWFRIQCSDYSSSNSKKYFENRDGTPPTHLTKPKLLKAA
jgi:hypothetical protein